MEVNVFVVPDLNIELLTSGRYESPLNCWSEAGRYFRSSVGIPIYEQTLHSTATMASNIMSNFRCLSHARYFAERAISMPDASDANLTAANEIIATSQERMYTTILEMRHVVQNMLYLTKQLNRDLTLEIQVVNDVMLNLEKLSAVYGQEDTTSEQMTSVDVLSSDEKARIKVTVDYIKGTIIKALENKSAAFTN